MDPPYDALLVAIDASRFARPQVDLVEDLERRCTFRTDLAEHRRHLGDAVHALGIRCIDHVQQQRGVARFFQRCAKRRHQIVRQLADEADGVGDHDRLAGLQRHASHRGIERREQLTRCEDAVAGQRIEQRRLAGVGVADERDRRHLATAARHARARAPATNRLELALERADTAADQAPVGFELRFARTAQADAAALPLQMGPAAHQACGHVLKLRQFDLQLALVRTRPRREDVEDQAGAVDDARLERALEIALLARTQRVVEDHQLGTTGRRGRGDLLGLAAADEQAGVGLAAAASDDVEHIGTGRTGQFDELGAVRLEVGTGKIEMDQQRLLPGLGAFEHQPLPYAGLIAPLRRRLSEPIQPAAASPPSAPSALSLDGS